MPNIEYPRSPETPVSHLPFSPSVRFGDLIFCFRTGLCGQNRKDYFRNFRRGVSTLHGEYDSDPARLGQRSRACHPDEKLPSRSCKRTGLSATLRRVFQASLSSANDNYLLSSRYPTLRDRVYCGEEVRLGLHCRIVAKPRQSCQSGKKPKCRNKETARIAGLPYDQSLEKSLIVILRMFPAM